MTAASPGSESSYDLDLLQRSLRALSSSIDLPITFGGLATRDGAPLTSFVGTLGQSIHGLVIEPTQGLGGRALAERRPVTATHYRQATSITHRYDREVSAEGIVSLLAVPIVVEGSVRAVIYGGHRQPTQFGDTVLQGALRAARDLAWEYSVHDEVERRLAALESESGLPGQRSVDGAERQEHRALFAELREIGREIDDPVLAGRLDRASRGLGFRETPREPSAPALSPRELDVLCQVALGKQNGTVARQLGLTESTVKSYLSSAMRKLEAGSRYEAVVAARRAGLLP
ncbi:LuxR C-terminal-related transcriptional regulator [Glaciihabitans sp. INWT7]|uniref:helix-turn-helix transcriptional regulator n=1 Tax=Glaciihabitans sp. INWT7 TaxID=2596912 RepID=UPI00162599A1|nr:LuxR C-terminal-related transcriptional regulator [Glaciihabitans sp. INWT7]